MTPTQAMTGLPETERDKPALSLRTNLAIGVALVLLAEGSRYFTIGEIPMSALWPPAGIFVAAMSVYGTRALASLIPAMLLWTLAFEGMPPAVATMVVAGQTLGAGVAAVLMHRFWHKTPERKPMAELVALYILGALIGGGVSSVIGASAYQLSVQSSMKVAFYDLWLVYWAFEALGIILFAPVVYALLRAPQHFRAQLIKDWKRAMPWVWLTVALTLIGISIRLGSLEETAYASALGFSFFPLLCWFILQCRAANVLIAIPVFATVFVAFSLNGLAGLPPVDGMPELIRSLLLVGGLVIMAQVIALTTAEHTRLVHGFQKQASSDYLTGLYNDRGFLRRLNGTLQQDLTTDHPTWLVYMNVLEADRIEDLLGFDGSQQFEQLLAAILMSTVGHDSRPARIGDASYVVLLNAPDRTSLSREIDRIHDTFDGRVLEPGGQQIQIRIAIGAVPLDGNLSDHTHYLSAATEAALLAASQGRRIRLIDNTRELIEQRQSTSFQIERLKSALSENRLELYAQRIEPFSESDTELHYEILIRLRDRDASLIGPGGFLPVAEAFGFMLEIDQWVVATTLTTLAANPEWLATTSKCAINLAGASLSSGEIAPFIEKQLNETGMAARKLSFEITETEQISDRDTAVQQVRAIRALGCSVSLDDFGTGLATFDYLRTFELDYIKIDGVFVRELLENRNDQSMVRAICQVAHTMNLRTIAEFVEGEDVVRVLTGLGVNYGQGFGIARPCPLRELFTDTEENGVREGGIP